jgi:hypothetical protein
MKGERTKRRRLSNRGHVATWRTKAAQRPPLLWRVRRASSPRFSFTFRIYIGKLRHQHSLTTHMPPVRCATQLKIYFGVNAATSTGEGRIALLGSSPSASSQLTCRESFFLQFYSAGSRWAHFGAQFNTTLQNDTLKSIPKDISPNRTWTIRSDGQDSLRNQSDGRKTPVRERAPRWLSYNVPNVNNYDLLR